MTVQLKLSVEPKKFVKILKIIIIHDTFHHIYPHYFARTINYIGYPNSGVFAGVLIRHH